MDEHADYNDSITADNEPGQPVNTRSQFLDYVIEIGKTLLLAFLLYFAISTVTDRVRVENISMQPTLYEGQLLVVSKLAYQWGQPMRGDIIVFHHTQQPPEDYVKRIIGLPGDHIEISSGNVYVNGQLLDEPYIADPVSYQGEWDVPADSLFVLGDNRNRSSDSHAWGFVPMDVVVGRVVLRYWPLNLLQLYPHQDLLQAAS
jgi:signal peptidase I